MRLDFTGIQVVGGGKAEGTILTGIVSAQTHPEIFERVGALEICPNGRVIIFR